MFERLDTAPSLTGNQAAGSMSIYCRSTGRTRACQPPRPPKISPVLLPPQATVPLTGGIMMTTAGGDDPAIGPPGYSGVGIEIDALCKQGG